jgi:hypothetical protein
MRNDVFDHVNVTQNFNVETPGPIYTSLPPIVGFAVFLRSQRRMMQVVKKECRLLVEVLANPGRDTVE